ncbi:30S ribosomal protein S20 [Patescibacteria group bacterium]|nr:30S ribosomal protein S20 [Patescibacteria group bacterium]
MPLIKSAIKRAKQNEERRKRLLPYRTIMKTMIRRIVDLTNEGKKDEAAKHLAETFKAIDTAAKKKIIHPKNAARKKAKVARLVSNVT